jgi:hypothetical protein
VDRPRARDRLGFVLAEPDGVDDLRDAGGRAGQPEVAVAGGVRDAQVGQDGQVDPVRPSLAP